MTGINGLAGMVPAAYGAHAAVPEKGISPMERPNAVVPADAVQTGVAQAGPTQTGAAAPTECATCASRSYQDVSTDAGVSFKAPGKIDPSVAAATVMGHEQEHVAIAQARADEKGGRIVASVTLKTAICPECGRVYVAGGEARITTITPVEDPGRETDATASTGAPGADGSTSGKPGEGPETGAPPLVMEDGGADLFRSIYKKSMAAHYGLFVNARV
jgi:hypothetical protein